MAPKSQDIIHSIMLVTPVEVNVWVEYIMYKENKLIIRKLTHLQQTL